MKQEETYKKTSINTTWLLHPAPLVLVQHSWCHINDNVFICFKVPQKLSPRYCLQTRRGYITNGVDKALQHYRICRYYDEDFFGILWICRRWWASIIQSVEKKRANDVAQVSKMGFFSCLLALYNSFHKLVVDRRKSEESTCNLAL